MNKFKKVMLSILGGVEVSFSIAMPLLISILWITQFGTESIGSKLIFGLGLTAMLFRAIKIGWMK